MDPNLTAVARRTDHARYRFALIAFITLTSGVAMAGTAIAILTMAASPEDAVLSRTPAIGHPVTTSYGSMTIGQVERIGGPTAQDLGGMTHGIQSLVRSDEAQVVVSILLVNGSDRPVRVEPAQFRLTVEGATDSVVPTGSSIRPLRLASGVSIEASLVFVVPQTGAHISVVYADPGGPPITVPAGQLGEAPADVPALVDDPAHADDGHAP